MLFDLQPFDINVCNDQVNCGDDDHSTGKDLRIEGSTKGDGCNNDCASVGEKDQDDGGITTDTMEQDDFVSDCRGKLQ